MRPSRSVKTFEDLAAERLAFEVPDAPAARAHGTPTRLPCKSRLPLPAQLCRPSNNERQTSRNSSEGLRGGRLEAHLDCLLQAPEVDDEVCSGVFDRYVPVGSPTLKVAPLPGWDRTEIRPPIRVTSWRVM